MKTGLWYKIIWNYIYVYNSNTYVYVPVDRLLHVKLNKAHMAGSELFHRPCE